MTLAVVILNWNGRPLLEQFLPDLVRFTPMESADIYMVDNYSTDDSVAFVKANYPAVKLIENPENGGYARGYNEGLKSIKADAYCLINSDVQVTDGWLEPVIKIFQSQPKTAIIQPKILDYKRPTYFEYAGAAGGFIDRFAYPYCRGRIFDTLEEDQGQYDDETDIFWASGACFFIRSEVFWALGAFDEQYFAHQEEIDLCWRAYNAGYTARYTPHSTVFHVGGATLNHAHWRKTFLNFRNSLFNIVKNKPGPFLGLVVIRLLLDGVAGLKFLLEGKPTHTWAIIKAHGSFYKHLKYVIRKRKKQPDKRLKYASLTNIVFSYFVLNNKTFKSLR